MNNVYSVHYSSLVIECLLGDRHYSGIGWGKLLRTLIDFTYTSNHSGNHWFVSLCFFRLGRNSDHGPSHSSHQLAQRA